MHSSHTNNELQHFNRKVYVCDECIHHMQAVHCNILIACVVCDECIHHIQRFHINILIARFFSETGFKEDLK